MPIALNSMTGASFIPKNCDSEMLIICEISVEQTVDTCETDIILGRPPLKCYMGVSPWGNITNQVFREHGELSRVVLFILRVKIRSGCVIIH